MKMEFSTQRREMLLFLDHQHGRRDSCANKQFLEMVSNYGALTV